VLSGNACKTGTASFQLPANPCNDQGLNFPCSVDDPTFQNYAVYSRLVGQPNTGVNVTTCAADPATSLIVCSTESWVSVRANGKNSAPKFTNVSKELLSICVDTSVPADGTCDTRLALFASQLQDYFWNWDTTGKGARATLFRRSSRLTPNVNHISWRETGPDGCHSATGPVSGLAGKCRV
jgi:hypothetical protein